MPKLEEITSLLNNPSKKDLALITKAYDFAEEAHRPQTRFSGEPYFNHVFATAKNLAELGMGPITISAGLLHDTLEDAGVSEKTLEEEFGKEILFLVDGVTKLGKLRYHGAERHIESLRKLFVAMSKDLRVLIIKLCDRLHNMETLKYVKPEKQKRIASETLEIYAPLAYRLGIRRLSRQLEDLSFPYVYPHEFEKVKNLFKERSHEKAKHLEKFHKSIIKGLAKAGITQVHTNYRVKGLWSLYQKLKRKDWDLEKVYDISALRIIVPTVADCYRVLGVIHGIWRPLPGRIKDYIAFPKPNGYRGLHTTIFTGDGSILEIQIRTEEMHQEAEYGVASHLEYKDQAKRPKTKENPGIIWVKQILPSFIADKFGVEKKNWSASLGGIPEWIKQLGEIESSKENREFLENLQTDFFKNRIFLFTPKGDVVDLPIESSPIDFAYAIHSDIGDHTSGTMINGKMAPLDHKLENGDIVEIITKEASHPSAKWLDFATTAMARKHIKSAIEKLKRT